MNHRASDPNPAPAPSEAGTTSPSTPAADGHVENPSPPRVSRRPIWLGGVTVGLGTLAEVLGNVKKIEQFFLDMLGWQVFQNIRTALLVIVGAAILAGYAAAAYWLYQKWGRRTTGRAVAFLIPGLLGIAALAGANFLLLPPPPDLKAFALKESAKWRDALLKQQRPSGGIPVNSLDAEAPTQVWTTAQAIKGALAGSDPTLAGTANIDRELAERIRKAFDYIEDARIKLPPGGWGYFEEWQTGVTEIAGWVGVAELASLESGRRDLIWPGRAPEIVARVDDVVQLLIASQQDDGGWGPTADRSSRGLSRTYSTTMALWCLIEARRSESMHARMGNRDDPEILRGLVWLASAYSDSPVRSGASTAHLGWVPNPTRKLQNERFPGLNAQVLYVLSRAEPIPAFSDLKTIRTYVEAKEAFLGDPDLVVRSLDNNTRLHDGDRYIPRQIVAAPAAVVRASTANAAPAADRCVCPPFTVESSTFLWYPWSLAAARALAAEESLSTEPRARAVSLAAQLESRLSESSAILGSGFYYILAEFAIGASIGPAVSP